MLEMMEILPIFALFVSMLSLASTVAMYVTNKKPNWKYRKAVAAVALGATLASFMLSVVTVALQ